MPVVNSSFASRFYNDLLLTSGTGDLLHDEPTTASPFFNAHPGTPSGSFHCESTLATGTHPAEMVPGGFLFSDSTNGLDSSKPPQRSLQNPGQLSSRAPGSAAGSAGFVLTSGRRSTSAVGTSRGFDLVTDELEYLDSLSTGSAATSPRDMSGLEPSNSPSLDYQLSYADNRIDLDWDPPSPPSPHANGHVPAQGQNPMSMFSNGAQPAALTDSGSIQQSVYNMSTVSSLELSGEAMAAVDTPHSPSLSPSPVPTYDIRRSLPKNDTRMLDMTTPMRPAFSSSPREHRLPAPAPTPTPAAAAPPSAPASTAPSAPAGRTETQVSRVAPAPSRKRRISASSSAADSNPSPRQQQKTVPTTTTTAHKRMVDHSMDNVVTCGIYTRAERRAKIQRYMEKRKKRHFKPAVIYKCRKSFADMRPRIGGRFVKLNGKTIEELTAEMAAKKAAKQKERAEAKAAAKALKLAAKALKEAAKAAAKASR